MDLRHREVIPDRITKGVLGLVLELIDRKMLVV